MMMRITQFGYSLSSCHFVLFHGDYVKCPKSNLKLKSFLSTRDWLQDDLMRIAMDDENDPVWIPFGFKVTLLDNGKLKLEEYSDEDPLPEDTGKKKPLY